MSAPSKNFRTSMREEMNAQGVSMGELARRTTYDRSYISHILAGRRAPTAGAIARISTALGISGVPASSPESVSAEQELHLLDAVRRAEHSDVSMGTIEILAVGVDRLCRAYPTMPGHELRDRSKALMDRALSLLDGRTTLSQHRELLVQVGWLACLLGCVHYDVRDHHAANTARRAAFRLGEQAGHGEVIGWSFEMDAWFALTEGRFEDVVAVAQAGRDRAGVTSAGVQLVLQEAKARARMGDDRAHEAIQHGQRLLAQLSKPDHPEHHFIFDPSKYEFYAATIYTLLGWDGVAAEHAAEVVRQCEQPDGRRWPMRLADARINLGMLAARRGDLDEAVAVGSGAFEFDRRSGSMLSRASDLLSELRSLYPGERLVVEYHDRLVSEKARSDA
ncbi:transcriptional regulator with XRE-family HTH domain [Murinocardiopsis flavida]|uniref:Transcriptional regulator with XRE-family HTH domain n=1 Tax=Murinocardiopsis flavida TaxID=645275 RepID=A0A2P8DG60_9ACTN|nr:helix-turn-helix transcriptional regulator [Murinocardiopsis flavida]PSK96201.1 transcriptional regulator with XRE-family HTH domain [Murinocardiopsis flavida]